MRRLPKPTMNRAAVYADCVESLPNAALSAKFIAAEPAVAEVSKLYAQRAAVSELHLFSAAAWGNDDQIVLANLTKKDFVDLYETQMSKGKGRGRSHYDQLRMTELGICPLCGFGHVSTLDHFAAKARYPAFSVLPINLVPACSDCNKKMGAGVIELATTMPHPYFEDERIETESWLLCDVQETNPVTVTYRVDTPAAWSEGLCKRVRHHFKELELATRYAVQAGSHLANIKDFLADLKPADLQTFINRRANRFSRPNEWESALYTGLFRSNWFMQEGYRLRTGI